MIREYYKLAKPGIIYGNVLTTIAAFFFAWGWHESSTAIFVLFFATVLGLSLVIGSACVFNNYIDRDIDARMERTGKRALVTGKIKPGSALIYGTILGMIGVAILYIFVNTLTTMIALTGFVFYVLIYGIAKRASYLGAAVGTIPGAVPIVVGYVAVAGRIDREAIILFLILVAWQLPHFYAIAMYRVNEYTAAGIPVLPAIKGMRAAKLHIVMYILAFMILTVSLWAFGYAGITYAIVVLALGLFWYARALQGMRSTDSAVWGKKVFLNSLIVLLGFSFILTVAPLLP